MGHLENANFLIATSLASSVILMIFWSFGFLRMGTVGLVSQSLAKGDYHEIVNLVVRNIILSLIIIVAAFRELLGFGTLLDYRILPEFMNNGLMILAPGAFIILGLIIWAQRSITQFVED